MDAAPREADAGGPCRPVTCFARDGARGEAPCAAEPISVCGPTAWEVCDCSTRRDPAVVIQPLPGQRRPLESVAVVSQTIEHFSFELDGQCLGRPHGVCPGIGGRACAGSTIAVWQGLRPEGAEPGREHHLRIVADDRDGDCRGGADAFDWVETW